MDKFTKLIIMILAVFLVAAQIPAAYVNTALSEGTPHDISIETVSSVAGIECPEITGGTVAAYNSSSEQISSAAAGEQVVLIAYPEVEYVLSYMSSIPDVTLTRIDDIMYSFEMPDEEVLIKAVFEKGNREGTRENPWHIGSEENPNGIMAYLDGDNVLSIKSGEGVPYVMKDFDTDTSTAPYVYFLKPVKKIDVSEGVPNIGDYAFFNPYGISRLTEINLPDSLTHIGKYAFSGYSSIEKLTIPADVTPIGENCFLGDTNLHTIIFEGKPGDLSLIDENAFSGITARVYIPSSWLAPDGTFDPSAYQFGGNLTYIVEGTAQIVETGYSYAMVQDAVNDASDGQTIKMNADLTENVTIPENLTVTLDLNGHVLTGTGTGTVITVNSGANLTLTDSSEGKTGTVTGGSATNGGGIYNNGTFNMTGGTITGNTAAEDGGGVYSNGAFTLGGASVIRNNTADDAENNVYLPNNKYIKLDTNAAPTSDFNVGVTTQTVPTANAPVQITTNVALTGISGFSADSSAYEVKINNDHLELAVKATPSHTHVFTYTASSGTLAATCTEGCDKGYDTTPLTLTLTPPTDLVYDGNAKAVTFADGEADTWEAAVGTKVPIITYAAKEGSELTDGKAVKAGSYTASATVDNKTATIDFTITSAESTITTVPTASAIIYGQTLADSVLTDGVGSVEGTFAWMDKGIVPAVSDSESTEYEVIFTPTDNVNYSTATCKVKLTVNPVIAILSGISISKAPDKTIYTEGETFDGTGMIVTATYSDGSSKAVTGYDISPSCALSVTDTTVEIRYTENGVTKHVNLIIRVNPTGPVVYKIITGKNQTVFTEADSAMFASDADFSKFDHVEVDGRTVAKKYYTAESGSTVIIFNRDYIKTLRRGEHKLTIVSNDGSASTIFMVSVPLPPTGDNAHPALLMMLLLTSMGMLLLISAKAKKRNED